MIKFTQKQINASNQYPCTLLEVEIEEGVAVPSDLTSMVVPRLPRDKGVIISGRLPIWLFLGISLTIAEDLIEYPWIATLDPRLGGAVVVSTHIDSPKFGEVVTLPK